MTVRIDIPVVTSDKDFTLVAGDTVKILACQGVCLIRIREVVDATPLGNGIVVLDVLAEIEATGDDSGDKQSNQGDEKIL